MKWLAIALSIFPAALRAQIECRIENPRSPFGDLEVRISSKPVSSKAPYWPKLYFWNRKENRFRGIINDSEELKRRPEEAEVRWHAGNDVAVVLLGYEKYAYLSVFRKTTEGAYETVDCGIPASHIADTVRRDYGIPDDPIVRIDFTECHLGSWTKESTLRVWQGVTTIDPDSKFISYFITFELKVADGKVTMGKIQRLGGMDDGKAGEFRNKITKPATPPRAEKDN